MRFLASDHEGALGPLQRSSCIGTQMRKFFDSLRHSYDYIIVDFAPLMPIVDVRASTNLVDAFIYVVAWGHTRTDFVEQALRSARGVYEHLLGVVLNKVDLRSLGTVRRSRQQLLRSRELSSIWLYRVKSAVFG